MCDIAVDISQSVVTTAVVVSQLGMIQAHDVEQGGMQIVDRTAIFNRVVSVFVGFSVAESRFDASACHPHRKPFGMVITAGFGVTHLDGWGATEFSAP